MTCEPEQNFFNIKFILKAAVRKSWGVDKDHIWEIFSGAGAGFYR